MTASLSFAAMLDYELCVLFDAADVIAAKIEAIRPLQGDYDGGTFTAADAERHEATKTVEASKPTKAKKNVSRWSPR